MLDLTLTPPFSPREPVTDILHGVTVTDPYRWLEDQNSGRTRKWVEEQSKYTRAYLDGIPGRDRIRKRVEELLAVETVSEPWKIGERTFYLKRKAQQEQPVIMMREGVSDTETVLVDPAARADTKGTALNIISISNNGKVLAYGVRLGGTHLQAIEFLDVENRQLLPDRLPIGLIRGLVFSSRNDGFYYSHEIAGSPRPHYRRVCWHELGTSQHRDLEIFAAGEDPKLRLGLIGSADGHILGYVSVYPTDPLTFEFHLQNVLEGKPVQKILRHAGSMFEPIFAGNKLLALTDWKAPNLRVVAVDPAHPDPDHWPDIVPESQQRIKDFAVVGNFICVSYVDGLSTRIELWEQTGPRHRAIPCPPNGTARLIRRPAGSDTLFYNFSSFERSPTLFSYNLAHGNRTMWAQSQDRLRAELKRVHYKSKDGTNIPMILIARPNHTWSSPSPALLGGYGGFGSSLTPQWNAYSTFLVERGFLFAIPSLRGGGEFGAEWHNAAKRQNRQTAFDDFIAAAEWLQANGHTAPGKLAIVGGSNAGLLMGAALTQRPDLFRVVICLGPLLDMLRYHLFDGASSWVGEYGSSENPEDFRYLLAYSPYHRVREGVCYPSVLLISGDADTCCNPMHARKMAARLQYANTSPHPILLDYKESWGHVPVQPLTSRIEALTDRLAFICHELGVAA